MGFVRFAPPVLGSPLHRNLLLDGTAWVGFGITSALIGGLLPAIARREGVEPLGLAMLSAVPFVAMLLGLLAGRYGPGTPRALAILRVAGSAALGLLLMGPNVTWIVAATAIYWISHTMGMPLQQRLWGVMYPTERRGRLLGIVGSGRYAAAGLALLVAGLVTAWADGPVIVAVGGLFGAACALGTARLGVSHQGETTSFSVRGAMGSVIGRPVLRRLTVAHGLFGGGLIAAAPLVTLVLVDRLGLSMAEIGMVGMTGAIATLASLVAWGALADRRGSLLVIALAGLIGVVGLALYGLAATWVVALLAAGLVGLASGGLEIAVPLLIATQAPGSEQARATAGMNALLGLRGIFVPILAVAGLELGLWDIGGAMTACVIASALGAALYLRVPAREGSSSSVSSMERTPSADGRSSPAPLGAGTIFAGGDPRFATLR